MLTEQANMRLNSRSKERDLQMTLNLLSNFWATAVCATALTAAAATGAELATSDHESGTARAEVLELKRIPGGMLMLRVAISNTGRTPMDSTQFDGPSSVDSSTFSGTNLIDPLNKKKYFVVRDGVNTCVCSQGLKSLLPGARMLVWARYPAPPEGVQKISVMIPHFLPMDEVAIGK